MLLGIHSEDYFSKSVMCKRSPVEPWKPCAKATCGDADEAERYGLGAETFAGGGGSIFGSRTPQMNLTQVWVGSQILNK
jgi:hypothetical protein